jgi:hypothetical protein
VSLILSMTVDTGMDKRSFNGTRKDACFRPLQLVQSSSLPHLACCTNVNSLCTPRCSQTAGALHLFCISIAASLLDVVYHLLSAAALYDVCAIVFSMAEMTDNEILMNSFAAFVVVQIPMCDGSQMQRMQHDQTAASDENNNNLHLLLQPRALFFITAR